MKATELIAALQALVEAEGQDLEVRCQTAGCCAHGHDLDTVGMGQSTYGGTFTKDEVGVIIIRAS